MATFDLLNKTSPNPLQQNAKNDTFAGNITTTILHHRIVLVLSYPINPILMILTNIFILKYRSYVWGVVLLLDSQSNQ